MNLTRLFIVVPLYVAIVFAFDHFGVTGYLMSLPFSWVQVWAIEVVALVLGAAGAFFFLRSGGFLEQNPRLIWMVIAHGCTGLFFASVFGLFYLFQNKFPQIANLIIIPSAFALSELVYVLVMRAWVERQARQKEFDEDP